MGAARDWASSPGNAATWPEDAFRLEIRKSGGVAGLAAVVDEVEQAVAAVLLGKPKGPQRTPSGPKPRRKNPAVRNSVRSPRQLAAQTAVPEKDPKRSDVAGRAVSPSNRRFGKSSPKVGKKNASTAAQRSKPSKAARAKQRKVAEAWTPHRTPGQKIDALKKPITNIGPLKPWVPLPARPEVRHPDRPAGYSTTDWISSKS